MLSIRLTGDQTNAAGLVPFGKKLAAMLVMLGVPKLTRALGTGTVEVLKVGGMTHLRIHGVGFVDDLVLFSTGARVWGYNWRKDKLAMRGRFDGELFQARTQRIDTDAPLWLVPSGGKVVASEGAPFDSVAMLPFHDIAVYRKGDLISVRHNLLTKETPESPLKKGVEVVTDIALASPAGGWNSSLPLFPSLFYVGAIAYSNCRWSLLEGPELWMINTRDPKYSEAPPFGSFPAVWRWHPRIWNPEPGNFMQLAQGMYYGHPLAPLGPYDAIPVRFGCMLSCKGGSQF